MASTKITSNRKLQQEVDNLMKKVAEQMAAFDDLFQKALEAEGTPKREKVVAELKKELNKLQRSNHELKSMAGNSDIRDDAILVEHTKSIQTAMGEYWELEKGAKTKKFSDRALSSNLKNSAEDQARIEQENWLAESLDQLKQQRESADFALERDRGVVAAALAAASSGKGGKRKAPKVAAISSEDLELRENCLIARSKYHTFKIESLLRALRNGCLDSYSIAATKEEISEVLAQLNAGDLSDPEWKDMDEGIYDPFDLPEVVARDSEEDISDEEEDTVMDPAGGGGVENARRTSEGGAVSVTTPLTAAASAASPTKKGKKVLVGGEETPTTHVDPAEPSPEPAVPVWTGKAAIPQVKETPVSEIGKVIARAKETTNTSSCTPTGNSASNTAAVSNSNSSRGGSSETNSPLPQNNLAPATNGTAAPIPAAVVPAVTAGGPGTAEGLPSLGGSSAALGGVWGRPAQQHTSASIAAQKVAEAPTLDSLAPALPDAATATTTAKAKTKRQKTSVEAEPPVIAPVPVSVPAPVVIAEEPKRSPALNPPVKKMAAKTVAKKSLLQQPAATNNNVSLGAPPVPASSSPWGSKSKATDKNLAAALSGEVGTTTSIDNNIVFDISAGGDLGLESVDDLTTQRPPSGISLMMEDESILTQQQHSGAPLHNTAQQSKKLHHNNSAISASASASAVAAPTASSPLGNYHPHPHGGGSGSLWGGDTSTPAATTEVPKAADVVDLVSPTGEQRYQEPMSMMAAPASVPSVQTNSESDQQFSSILDLLMKGMGQDDCDSDDGITSSGKHIGGSAGGFGSSGGLLGALDHRADPFSISSAPPPPPSSSSASAPHQASSVLGSDFLPQSQTTTTTTNGSNNLLPKSGSHQQFGQPSSVQQHLHHNHSHHHHHQQQQPPPPPSQPPAPSHTQFGEEPAWNPPGMNAGAVPFMIPNVGPSVMGAHQAGTPSGSQGPPASGGNNSGWGSPPSSRSGAPPPNAFGGGQGGAMPPHPQQQPPPPPPQHSISVPSSSHLGQSPHQSSGASPPAVPQTPPSYSESQTPPQYARPGPGFPGGNSSLNAPPPLANMPPSVLSPNDDKRTSGSSSAPWGSPASTSGTQQVPPRATAAPAGYLPPPDSQRNKLYAPQQPTGAGGQGPQMSVGGGQGRGATLPYPSTSSAASSAPPQSSFGQPPPLVAPRSQQIAQQPGYAQNHTNPPQQPPLIPRVGGLNPTPGPFGAPRPLPGGGELMAPSASPMPSQESATSGSSLLLGGDQTSLLGAGPRSAGQSSLMSILGSSQQSQSLTAPVLSASGGASGATTPVTVSIPGTPMRTQTSGSSPTGPMERALPAPATTHVFWDFSTIRPKLTAAATTTEPKRETTKFWKQLTEVLKQPDGPGTTAKFFVKANLTKPQVFFRQSDPKETQVMETFKLLRVEAVVAEQPRKSLVEAVKQLLIDQGILTFNGDADDTENAMAPAIGQRASGANPNSIKVVIITADPCCAEALSLCQRADVNFCVLHGFEEDSEDAELLNYWVETAPQVALRHNDLVKDLVEVVPVPVKEKPAAPLTAAARAKLNATQTQVQQTQSASTTKKGPIGGAAAHPSKGKRGY